MDKLVRGISASTAANIAEEAELLGISQNDLMLAVLESEFGEDGDRGLGAIAILRSDNGRTYIVRRQK